MVGYAPSALTHPTLAPKPAIGRWLHDPRDRRHPRAAVVEAAAGRWAERRALWMPDVAKENDVLDRFQSVDAAIADQVGDDHQVAHVLQQIVVEIPLVEDGILAGSAVDGVVAEAGVEGVVALAAVDGVVAVLAPENVVSVAALDRVCAVATLDHIAAVVALQQVAAVAAVELVSAKAERRA